MSGFIPTKASASNWCQHVDLELTLHQGLNMIKGPNGSGKSNAIDLILMLLSCESNNVNRKIDKKTDNITDGCTEAFLRLDFLYQDVPGHIVVKLKRNYDKTYEILLREIDHAKRRVLASQEDPSIELDDETLHLAGFKPSDSVRGSMVWGEKKLTKQSAVLEWLTEKLGQSPKVIKSTMFPRQGDVDALISGDPEARQKALSDQAGVALCAKIHKELGDEVSRQPSFDGVEAKLAEAKQKKTLRDNEVSIAAEEVKKLKELETDGEPIKEKIRLFNAANEVRQKRAENMAKKDAFKTQLRDMKADMDEKIQKGTDLKLQFEDLDKTNKQDRAVVERFYEQGQRKDKIEVAELKLSEANDAVDACGEEPKQPCDQYINEPMKAENAKLEVENQNLKDRADLISQGKCPTCGADFVNADDEINKIAKSVDINEQIIARNNESIRSNDAAYQAWKADHDAWHRDYGEATTAVAVAKSTLDSIPELEGEDVTLEDSREATARIEEHEALKEKLEKARADYDEVYKYHQSVENDLKVVEALLAEAEKDVEGAPTKEEFDTLAGKLAELQSNRQRQIDAEKQLAVAEAQAETAAKEVERCEAEVSRAKPTKDWTTLVSMTRDLFHKNGPPREAVLWYAKRLVEQTNHYLKDFDAEFRMTMGDDMSFIGVFPGKVMPSGRLSGGEKNMLNLSLRFAYSDLYPTNLQFMELDEVEVHLDEEHVARLPYLFEKVKSLARSRGLVVLFISHHPALADIADHVTEL